MTHKRSIKTLAVGIILAALGISILIYAFTTVTDQIGYGYHNNNFTVIDKKALDKMYIAPKKGVKIDKINNSIEFYGKNVSIPIVASPGNTADMYSFGVYGLINPTLIVYKDAKVTMHLANEDDDMYHNIAVVDNPPPYPYMSMMYNVQVFGSSYIPPLPKSKEGKYFEMSNSFTVSQTGTFYFICQVMGHAYKGMYGKFVVIDNPIQAK